MASDLAALLARLPAPPLQTRLARCVALTDFQGGSPPRYLFASRHRSRCNSEGVECVYFSVGEGTAGLEYERHWAPLGSHHQPKLTFFAEMAVAHMIDLGDAEIRDRLDVGDGDLFGGYNRYEGRQFGVFAVAWLSGKQRVPGKESCQSVGLGTHLRGSTA